MQLDEREFEDFSPKDFLVLASELNLKQLDFDSSGSSIKRTIFGRSYYAAFLSVREFLASNTEYVSNPFGEHTRIPNFIKSRGPFNEEDNEKIYRDLLLLKKLRHQTDYYLEVPPIGTKEHKNWLFNDVDYAIDVASKIIDMFENRFKNS